MLSEFWNIPQFHLLGFYKYTLAYVGLYEYGFEWDLNDVTQIKNKACAVGVEPDQKKQVGLNIKS